MNAPAHVHFHDHDGAAVQVPLHAATAADRDIEARLAVVAAIGNGMPARAETVHRAFRIHGPDGARARGVVSVTPPEPDCTDAAGHHWLVGQQEGPHIRARVCLHCARVKFEHHRYDKELDDVVTDVRYEDAGDASERFAAAKRRRPTARIVLPDGTERSIHADDTEEALDAARAIVRSAQPPNRTAETVYATFAIHYEDADEAEQEGLAIHPAPTACAGATDCRWRILSGDPDPDTDDNTLAVCRTCGIVRLDVRAAFPHPDVAGPTRRIRYHRPETGQRVVS